ncbi:hypothetical protein ACO2Q8_08985 [Larkinella sp. VNQ87]|uniref:hypothetical protein n=1 Tax=Larkinella sp. VNQ87 TaxID=3400921 RepID=UPI003C00EB4B
MTTSIELFSDMLRSLVALRKYVKIFYMTDLNELLQETSIITAFNSEPAGDFIALSSGNSIPLKRLVTVNGVYAPGHEDYESCLDCRL